MSDTKKEIEQVLKNTPGDIAFEPIPNENESPLAQPVVEKPNAPDQGASSSSEKKEEKTSFENKEEKKKEKEKTDAPEQEINADPEKEKTCASSDNPEQGEEFTVPIGAAGMMADSILGMVNNTVLEVGAGYFVTITKHKDFYDFDELIQVIEEQNAKNIKRIKLDEEDKAMLRPLLIHILRKKAKVLTPEQQLLGVCLSIIVKKAKMVMEIRAENEMLVDRILDIIRKEMARNDQEEKKEEGQKREDEKKEEEDDDQQQEVEVIYETRTPSPKSNNQSGLPDSVLETTG